MARFGMGSSLMPVPGSCFVVGFYPLLGALGERLGGISIEREDGSYISHISLGF